MKGEKMKKNDVLMLQPIYHVCNKSIEGYNIFRSDHEYQRFLMSLSYYKYGKQTNRFARYLQLINEFKAPEINKTNQLVNIYTYCIMPTHYHLLVEELVEKGIEKFVHMVETSYAVFFNTKYKRKGHLWQNKYKKIPLTSNNQFLHTTRYLHINPVKSRLIINPKDWKHSSYLYYISKEKNPLLDDFTKYMSLSRSDYKEFVEKYLDDLF
ncbi:MAG: transposase [Candidatus Omnitrophica bacterium]|nr:transposase [Candidatus Omnitrophota bacterium]